jgi:murein DD-endopeptidase MepM/ murein hydrolase activator NlpD
MGHRPAARRLQGSCPPTCTTRTRRAALTLALALFLLAPSARAQLPSPTPSLPPVPLPSPTPPAPPQPDLSPAPGNDRATDAREKVQLDPEAPAPSSTGNPELAAIWWEVGYRYPGVYTTDGIVAIAGRLKELGAAPRATQRAFAPFIIAGYARFWDSWGEVRHAEGDTLRPHLGQDVFCAYGSPVLASEHGTIELATDPLGGLIARLHRSDGSYWYYAHLSGYPQDLATGQVVDPGDVIGYCGTSGNAYGTDPHVHFGLYSGGVALNPMSALISWVKDAHAHADEMLDATSRSARRSAEAHVETRVARLGDPSVPRLFPRCYPKPPAWSLFAILGAPRA